MNAEFSLHVFEKPQVSGFTKIRPVGAKLIHAGGQTDMAKLIVFFFKIVGTRLKMGKSLVQTQEQLYKIQTSFFFDNDKASLCIPRAC
jgi:hypothetical protein